MTKKLERVEGMFTDTAQVPRGTELFYRCLACNGTIPSQPRDSVGCPCGNVFIDVDYHRLVVRAFERFAVLKATKSANSSR
jgi:hypothetical protein